MDVTISSRASEALPGRPGYQPGTFSPRAMAMVLVLHVMLASAVLLVRTEIEPPSKPQPLTTFDISEPRSQPEPAPQPQPAEPLQPEIVAPRPKIVVPREKPVIQTVALEPIRQPVALTIPGPPVQTAATKSAGTGIAKPITPPDFNAAQLGNPAPRYPYQARRAYEEGIVLLRVLVSENGRARTVDLAQSSGSDLLDAAAVKTVRGWRFLPAQQAGRAVEAWVLVPITFSLG